jgi:hypothetical protein
MSEMCVDDLREWTGDCGRRQPAETEFSIGDFRGITGLYEKVTKVKADVAAVLVSATQRFGDRYLV